jgi:hypothetical protein
MTASLGQSFAEAGLHVCEFHGTTYPDGCICPACLRTPEFELRMMREMRDVKARLSKIESDLAKAK